MGVSIFWGIASPVEGGTEHRAEIATAALPVKIKVRLQPPFSGVLA